MSFDIFVACFEDGGHFPRSIMEEAFGAFVTKRGSRFWDLRYGEHDHGTIYLNDGEMVAGFSVNRPPGSDRFWSALLRLLEQTKCALYWPGCQIIAIGREDTIPHIPPDMIKSLGPPTLIPTAGEIVDRIRRS